MLLSACDDDGTTEMVAKFPLMDRRRALVVVSAAEVVVTGAGAAVALTRGHAYDVPMLRGRVENIRRDSVLVGTALSPPAVMVVAQVIAVLRLACGESRWATVLLGTLGEVMVVGHLSESLVRRRLRPSDWERTETPIVVAGLSLSCLMAALALTMRRRGGEAR